VTQRTEEKELYLLALRGDAVAQRKCTEKGKQCGGRCIPKSWNCRIKGEGQTPPTRGNRIQLSPEQKEKVLKARRQRRIRAGLKAAGTIAGVVGAAAGAAAIAKKNPQAMRRAASKAGLSANFAGMASNVPGPVGRAAAVANMGLASFQAGATAGANFGSNRGGVKRLAEYKSAIAARAKVIKRTEARIKDLQDTRGLFEVERTKLLGRMGDSGSKAQQRTLKSISSAINKKSGEIATASAKLSALERRNASLTRGTKKIEGLLGGQYNTAQKIYEGVEQTNKNFRAGRRQTSSMRPKQRSGPKPDTRSMAEKYGNWRKNLGLFDEAEREDKKCGKSGIPDNAKCTKQTAKGSHNSGSGEPKKRSLVNRISRKISGAEKLERFEREQKAREKKYGKHSPDANGGEAVAPDGPLGRLLKKKGIDPNKIGGNSDLAIELSGKMEPIGKSEKNFRFKSGTKIPKLPAQYLLRKERSRRDALSERQEAAMQRHAEHHTKKHMKEMRRLMEEGKSFSEAHKIAMKMVGK